MSPRSASASCCKGKISCFQLKIYFCVFVLMFTNSFTITVTYPFLPFMVEFLVPTVNAITLGNYVGILPTSYNAGRFFGSYVWGNIADYKGRKPVVIINCVLMALTAGVFGFSPNFIMAVIVRFCAGASNCLPAALKAALSEASSNKSQALAMGVYATGWGLGLVIGPAVGGALANPVAHYNLTSALGQGTNVSSTASCSDGVYPCLIKILQMFPYSPPCVVNALLIVIAMVLAIFLLPETLKSKKKKKEVSVPERSVESGSSQQTFQQNDVRSAKSTADSTHLSGSSVRNTIDPKDPDCQVPILDCPESTEHLMREGDIESDNERTVLLRTVGIVHRSNDRSLGNSGYGSINSPAQDDPRDGSAGETNARASETIKCCSKLYGLVKKPLKNAWIFIRDPVTRKALIIYCTFSFAFNGLDEMYSLFCKTDPYLGGLGFQESQIGLSLAMVGALLLPIIVWLFPVLEKLIGTRRSFLFACICVMSGSVMLPSLTIVARQGNTQLLWALLILIMFVIKVAIGVCIACISLFINNSVFFHQLASVNGLALSITCISRTLAPVVTSSLWSASLTENSRRIGFPFDYHLIFVLCGLVYLCCVIIAAMLPKSIDKQKKQPASIKPSAL